MARLLDKPGLLEDLPLVVLQTAAAHQRSRATTIGRRLRAIDEGMEEYAAESTRGMLIHVKDTGHNIQDDRPEVVWTRSATSSPVRWEA